MTDQHNVAALAVHEAATALNAAISQAAKAGVIVQVGTLPLKTFGHLDSQVVSVETLVRLAYVRPGVGAEG